MAETISELAERMFVGPVWPASIMVCLLVVYTLVALLGLIDLNLDAPDIDLDADLSLDADMTIDAGTPDLEAVDFDVAAGDVDVGQAGSFEFLTGMAATTIRWTNFGQVPLVIWGGVFTVVYWMFSYGLWHGFDKQHFENIQ